MRTTRLATLDRAFVGALKRHQLFHSFLRTNSNGVVISEVVRGVKPERNYRKVGGQRWHILVKSQRRPYYGMLKGENGRYYLFWGRPILKATSRGEQFVGAIAAHIDLWDSFHKFTYDTDVPFLIKLGNITLYDHKWRDEGESVEEHLKVPGVSRISVVRPRPVPKTPEPDLAVPVAAAPPQTGTTEAAADTQSAHPATFSFANLTIVDKIVLGLMAVAALVLIVMIWRIAGWIKDWRIRRRIEREDNLFA